MDDKNKLSEDEYGIQWSGLPIKYLIRATKNYIVFIDFEYDIDWKTTNEFILPNDSDSDKENYHSVKNEIDNAECIPTYNLDEKIILGYKRQLAESLVRAFDGDIENARKMVALAKEYIAKRNIEQSRYLYLISSGTTTIVSSIALVVFWCYKDIIMSIIGISAFYLLLSFLIASLGALLSIISRIGSSKIDSSASKKLHYLEGVSRVLAGMISGLIVSIAIKVELILPLVSKFNSEHYAMLLGALIAGVSERFVPSIINKIEKEI